MYNLPAINSNITKRDLNIIAESTINELIDKGNIAEAIDVIAKMEYLIKEIRANNDFINYVRGYITLQGKEIELNTGTKIELAEVGVKYDFSKCNDEQLLNLEESKIQLDNLIKERQAFLKSLPSEGMDIVTPYGELVHVYPPSKSSTSSFKVTLKK